MNLFKEDCIWMSCRYAIGRKTISACTHPYHIIENAYDWIYPTRRKQLSRDIIMHINDRLNCLHNISSLGFHDKYDIISCIAEYMCEHNIQQPNEYFAQHNWNIDTSANYILPVVTRNEPQLDFEELLSTIYHDYESWILFANLLDESKHVTLRIKYNNKVIEHKCLVHYKIYTDGVKRYYVDIEKFKEKPYPTTYLDIKGIIDNEF